MVDIVEIALDNLTDYEDFEKLACEVLRNEGFPDIQVLGGQRDSGQDAATERFWRSEGQRVRTIFQITTQDAIESKLRATIKRLDEVEKDYQELFLVTNNLVPTDRMRIS